VVGLAAACAAAAAAAAVLRHSSTLRSFRAAVSLFRVAVLDPQRNWSRRRRAEFLGFGPFYRGITGL
jgi:hypothetical protein